MHQQRNYGKGDERMNRAEFMQRLEKALHGVPEEERRRAVEYYEHYFDEAGAEQEQEVLDALGAPEKAAADILQEFRDTAEAKQLQKCRKRRRNCILAGISAVLVICIGMLAAHTVISGKREVLEETGLAPEQEIHTLTIEAEGAQVYLQVGDNWHLSAGKSTTWDIQEGMLSIRQVNQTGFFQRQPGTMILTIPDGEVNQLNLDIGTGMLEIQHMTMPEVFTCHVGTGSAYLEDIETQELVLWADSGTIVWDGTVYQSAIANCDTGSLDVTLQEDSNIGWITGTNDAGKVTAEIHGGNFIEAANMTEGIAYAIPGTEENGELKVTCNTGKITLKIYTEGEDT